MSDSTAYSSPAKCVLDIATLLLYLKRREGKRRAFGIGVCYSLNIIEI